jgi:hypothetical protein
MSRKTDFEASTITLSLNLPRVVLIYGGSVGHVLINGENIASLKQEPGVDKVHSVACHKVDGHYLAGWDLRWAKTSDPTCRSCLRSLRFAINE